jgi:magnesium-transporting ATPase (P-type)
MQLKVANYTRKWEGPTILLAFLFSTILESILTYYCETSIGSIQAKLDQPKVTIYTDKGPDEPKEILESELVVGDVYKIE